MNSFFGFMNVIVNSFKISKIYNSFQNCWSMPILLCLNTLSFVKVLIHFPCAELTGPRTLLRWPLKLVWFCLMINKSAVYCLNDLHSFAIYCKKQYYLYHFKQTKNKLSVCIRINAKPRCLQSNRDDKVR